MFTGFLSIFGNSLLKLVSESLLSLYPVFIKRIQLPIKYQIWVRMAIYSIISLIFANFSTLLQYFFKPISILLALVNALHVFVSYIGFKILDSGVSYSIFYTYPVLILLFSGQKFNLFYLLPLIGTIILSLQKPQKKSTEKFANIVEEETKEIKEKNSKKKWWGILAMIAASITEVAIYFIVKRLDDPNSWNVLLLAYFLPAIGMSFYLNKNIWKKQYLKHIGFAAVMNGAVGSIGYFLRFFTISRLSTTVYAVLSYFGVIMAYVYGLIFQKEKITAWRTVGSCLIIISGIILYLTNKKN
jgi:drug/metabolite transporter (DMT)-like permease